MKFTIDKEQPIYKLMLFLIPFFTNIPKMFTKDFIKERWYLHFLCTGAGIVVVFRLFMVYTTLDKSGLFFQTVLCWGIGYGTNYFREWCYGEFKGAPFSYEDIHSGTYGGLVFFYIIFVILPLIF